MAKKQIYELDTPEGVSFIQEQDCPTCGSPHGETTEHGNLDISFYCKRCGAFYYVFVSEEGRWPTA